MKSRRLLFMAIATSTNPSIHGQESCPETHCSSSAITSLPPVPSSSCPTLTAVTLATYTHDNNILIELKGPASVHDAANLVLTSPHGGSIKPSTIPARATTGPYCNPVCKTAKDSYTKEISQLTQEKIISNYCKVPYLVINHLHRSRLDANREVGEGAQGHEIAGEAWFQFHNFTNYAQNQLRDYFGTSTVAVGDDNDNSGVSVTGVNALLLDMHGYAGYDWVDASGSPLIQWGYRLSDHPTLNPSNYCPLDTRSDGSIGSLTHARWMGGQSYECLVRGPGSMASRVSTLLDANGGLTSDGLCGHGTPSLEFPSPHDLANDPFYCEDMTLDTPDECHYYSGGYDLEVHERMDWENVVGDHFNAMQAELPRCIRFGGSDVREAFADVMSVAVMSFLMELYGDVLALMEDVE